MSGPDTGARLGKLMKFRDLANIVAIALALGSTTALAQTSGTVARLTDVEGNVLVSQGDAMVAATNNQRVPVGARVLTTTGAKVVVNYDVGCDVRLDQNQRFTVRTGACAALLSEVVAVGPAPGAIGGGTAVAGLSTAEVTLGVVAIVALGAGAYETFRNKSVSPN